MKHSPQKMKLSSQPPAFFLEQVQQCQNCTKKPLTYLKHSAWRLYYVLGLEQPSHRSFFTIQATGVRSSSLLQYCRTSDLKYNSLALSGVISLLWRQSINKYKSVGESTEKSKSLTGSIFRRLLLSFPSILLLQTHPYILLQTKF